MPPRSRLLFFSVLISLSSLAVACDLGREPAPCECPNLEAAVDGIDWAPGLERVEQQSAAGDGYLEVVVSFRGVTDPTSLLGAVEAALFAGGYEIQDPRQGVVEGTSGRISVTASELAASSDTELPGLRISVKYRGPDGPDAVEELGPLREELGPS